MTTPYATLTRQEAEDVMGATCSHGMTLDQLCSECGEAPAMTTATMQRYVIHTIGQTYTAAELSDAIEWVEANRNGIGVWITEAKPTANGYEYDDSAPIIRKWEATAPMMRSVSTAYRPYDR